MKSSIKILISAVLLMVAVHTKTIAQQDAMYSQYMFNYLLVNPGYAGSRDVLSMTGMYRRQWINVDGAPNTITFSGDMPLSNEKMGIGLTVFKDKLGVEANTGVYASYAYRVRLTHKGTLSFGANAGFTQYSANLADVNQPNPNDPAFGTNVREFNPNFGFGMFYSTDKFYVSLALPHILNNKLASLEELRSRMKRHYFLGMGYVLGVSPNVKLKPSFLLKMVEGAPLQTDLNLNIWYLDKLGIGGSYRTGDAVVALLEFQATTGLRFGYAYDITTSELARYASGTHEIMVRYEFATLKKKIITPRHF
ncbi:MAG: type IX secretion system membrane protein PorP/SprF [Cyclobacteriaceae bacterium]|nr:type IX secretion system membrane protein PorP/SprF [Cyclobacteriaceae bacterium]